MRFELLHQFLYKKGFIRKGLLIKQSKGLSVARLSRKTLAVIAMMTGAERPRRDLMMALACSPSMIGIRRPMKIRRNSTVQWGGGERGAGVSAIGMIGLPAIHETTA